VDRNFYLSGTISGSSDSMGYGVYWLMSALRSRFSRYFGLAMMAAIIASLAGVGILAIVRQSISRSPVVLLAFAAGVTLLTTFVLARLFSIRVKNERLRRLVRARSLPHQPQKPQDPIRMSFFMEQGHLKEAASFGDLTFRQGSVPDRAYSVLRESLPHYLPPKRLAKNDGRK
jgi:hypothetical protein